MSGGALRQACQAHLLTSHAPFYAAWRVRACLSTFGGCGFNGFGQLQLLPLKTSRTQQQDILDDEKTSNDCSAQSTAVSNSVSCMMSVCVFGLQAAIYCHCCHA